MGQFFSFRSETTFTSALEVGLLSACPLVGMCTIFLPQMIVPIAKGDKEIKTVQIRELKAWPSGVIEGKGWGEGEGEGSCKSHVLLSYTLVRTHSWTGTLCLVRAVGEGQLSSTLQVLRAGLAIKLTQDRVAGEQFKLNNMYASCMYGRDPATLRKTMGCFSQASG